MQGVPGSCSLAAGFWVVSGSFVLYSRTLAVHQLFVPVTLPRKKLGLALAENQYLNSFSGRADCCSTVLNLDWWALEKAINCDLL